MAARVNGQKEGELKGLEKQQQKGGNEERVRFPSFSPLALWCRKPSCKILLHKDNQLISTTEASLYFTTPLREKIRPLYPSIRCLKEKCLDSVFINIENMRRMPFVEIMNIR